MSRLCVWCHCEGAKTKSPSEFPSLSLGKLALQAPVVGAIRMMLAMRSSRWGHDGLQELIFIYLYIYTVA